MHVGAHVCMDQLEYTNSLECNWKSFKYFNWSQYWATNITSVLAVL